MTPQRFSAAATMAMLLVGVVAGMIPALQGLLLPELAREGRLTLSQLGQVAMAESLGTLLAIATANAKLRTRRLKRVVGCVAVGCALLDIVTPHLAGVGIVGARFAHGLCSGMLLWMWTSFLTRSVNPGRLVAFDVALQAGLIAALASWFSVSIIPLSGTVGAFMIVGAVYGATGLLAFLIPKALEPLPGQRSTMKPSLTGLIGLAGVLAMVSAIVGTWVYLKPFGEKAGFSAVQTNFAISAALASKVGAALLMTVIAGLLRPARTLLCLSAASLATLVVILNAPSSTIYVAGAAVFAFLWMCTIPMFVPFLIEIDSTRRSAIHIGTAQLLGAAAGPALASVAVSGGDATSALKATMCFYVVGGVAIACATMRRRRVIPRLSPDCTISSLSET